MKYIIIILIAFTAITGCETSAPKDTIDEETYKQMFIEFAIINQLDQQLLHETSRDELREMVYKNYGVTEEEFRISHEYYEQRIDDQLERVREMTLQLRSERDTLVTLEKEFKEAAKAEQIDSLHQESPGNE